MKVIPKVDYSTVAKLIDDGHIVAIYQGCDEGGPRALGNRSFLFNPRIYEMWGHVNILKKREWYRPVAGSILLEDFSEWFDNGTIEESPFMTYAIDVRPDQAKKIPAIIHKNKTCRIQTVREEDNPHYYNLIKAYKDLTGVPIVGNTSFNLGGEPIVHTLKQALSTLERSLFEYLYLPEKATLIYAKNEVS